MQRKEKAHFKQTQTDAVFLRLGVLFQKSVLQQTREDSMNFAGVHMKLLGEGIHSYLFAFMTKTAENLTGRIDDFGLTLHHAPWHGDVGCRISMLNV